MHFFTVHTDDWRQFCANVPHVEHDLRRANIPHNQDGNSDIADILECLRDAQRQGAHYAVLIHGVPERREHEMAMRDFIVMVLCTECMMACVRFGECRQYEDAFLVAMVPGAQIPEPSDSELRTQVVYYEGEAHYALCIVPPTRLVPPG